MRDIQLDLDNQLLLCDEEVAAVSGSHRFRSKRTHPLKPECCVVLFNINLARIETEDSHGRLSLRQPLVPK